MKSAGAFGGKYLDNKDVAIIDVFGKVASKAFPKASKAIRDVASAFTSGTSAAGVFKTALSSLWGVIAAHPILAAVAAIGVAIHLFDVFTVSAAEARENLSNLKGEYEENEGELVSLNDELSTTRDRIDELQAKGTLTITEQEELANLQNQNAELDRQKSLLESIQALKKSEINSAFVQTMDKDVDSTFEYQGWGGEGPEFYSDRDRIKYAFRDYQYYTNLIAQLDEQYADNLTDADYQKRREKYDTWRKETLEYLSQKNDDFMDAANGISYIPEPSNEDENRVNAWLDYINDYQDKMNILLGGSGAKSHAFSRVTTTTFKDVTADLQELGEQGKVTWDMLQDPKYEGFIGKMIELGVITGNDATSLQFLADAFNGLGVAIDNASGGVSEVSGEISNIKKSSDSTVKAINEISSAKKMLDAQGTGKSVSLGDLSAEGMEEYASALEYVNGVYQLNAEKVNEIIEAKVSEQIAVNDTNKAYAQSKYLQNAKQIEKYRNELAKAEAENDGNADAIRDNIQRLLEQNEVLATECAQYDLMSSSLAEATSAYQRWMDAQNASQTGDMFDGALSAVKQINDVLNNSESDMFGRVGRTDYKAAVDFIVPDSVDHDDAAAVNSYIESISDMFTFDDNGNRTGLNIANFIQKSLDEGLIAMNKAGTAYEIAGGKTMEDFARGLGLSLPLVRAMFGELEEFGAKFDWADEASKTIGDLGVAAYESAEALRSVDQFKDLKIVMDVSDFDDVNKACDTLDSTIEQMQDFKLNLNPDIDQAKLQQADDVIRYCVAQKQLLSAPAIMSVDVSKVTSEIAPALDLLQQFQNAQNMLEMDAAVGADTSAAEAEINGLVSQIQGLDPKILAQLGLDPTSTESIQTYIDGLDAEAIVKFGIDSSLVDAFEKASHSARGVVNWYDNTSNLSKSFSRVGYVYWKDGNSPDSGSGGGGRVNGSANASGSAKMRGDWRARGGRSLVGELGREIIVDPNTGRWYTVGDNGAEFVNIPEGAIIFNHKQSDALLENGRVAGRGKSYVNGSAFVTGFIPVGIGGGYGGGGNGSGSRNPGYHAPSGGASSSIESNYDKELETVDWIVVAIDRIERVIDKLGKTAESVFKRLRTRLLATNDEIETVTREIELQHRAYDKYMSAAEAVSLSSDLKQLVRNGAIDISQYDQDTQKLISDYQELYEKALDCSVAIDDLHETLASLYKSKFDAIQEDYNNQLSLLEKRSDALDRKIDMLEEQGYMQNANYYVQFQNIERKNIQTLKSELVDLDRAFNEAMSSGEIEEGSEAWYEMTFAIEDTKAAIEDAELAVVKYNNTIREIEWDYFDYAQERIEQITSEADFLMNLLDGKDMYDSSGNLSENGIAAGGLHSEKYGIYMAQADKYADEIKRINKELANDPNNTKLIERRDELVASQRDAILAAKSEKEALVDLAKGGVQIELDAIKKLIDAYTESLDSAKDLYDYQKKIADKAKNITDLEKQLAAYQNDASEETRSKIQKIQVQLADAKEDLKQTEYDRLVSDSKEMLDSLYTEYEEVLNSRFDDIDSTFASMIDLTNENFVSINEYLSKIADGVGYTISEETNSAWGNGGGANGFVSVYGEDISTKLTATGLTVEKIFGLLGEIARQNGVDFPAAKSYASGGLIDYTGVANVHGSQSNPELVLNASDTKNFIMLRNALRNMDGMSLYSTARVGDYINGNMGKPSISSITAGEGGYSVGSINISIPIERVEDYNDFVNKLRGDRQFEKMIQDITLGTAAGKSKLLKNKYKW